MIPINDEGQTIEGGHRWILDEYGEVDEWASEYEHHFGPLCREPNCYGGGCIMCDPNLYEEICPVASIQPYLPLELNV